MCPTEADGELVSSMFEPVTHTRASRVIVDQIRALIREGKLQPGRRLPSERVLCQDFGVSRVTVREALRVLEASGLVEIKVGARGGAFVTTPTPEILGEGLADLLSLSSELSSVHITEARMLLEINLLPLACERRTDSDVDELLAMVERGRIALREDNYEMPLSVAFHIQVASCTHNPAIESLVQTFHGPLLMSLREAQVAAPLMGAEGNTEHREIAEAIRDRDAERAVSVMRAHLQRTMTRLEKVERAG